MPNFKAMRCWPASAQARPQRPHVTGRSCNPPLVLAFLFAGEAPSRTCLEGLDTAISFDHSPSMQNTISVAIAVLGLVLALTGAWLTWGGWSTLVIAGGALFAFGLASID